MQKSQLCKVSFFLLITCILLYEPEISEMMVAIEKKPNAKVVITENPNANMFLYLS